MTWELLPSAFGVRQQYHAITKLRHNIDLKEIQHLTGMTHCSSFSGMEQFG
jgi:hypothetical protein